MNGYAEITRLMFHQILASEQILKPSEVIQSESYNKLYYHDVMGVTLAQVTNYVSCTTQYYIKDINK